MKTRLYILIILLWTTTLTAFAGEGFGHRLLRAARSVLTAIDSMAVRGVDRSYIGVPGRPWQVMVRGNSNQAHLDMSSTINASAMFHDLQGDYTSEPHITSGRDMFVGVWGGYRGYGLGYSRQVSGGGEGSLLTLGATGGSYGVNFRRHIFEADEFDVHNRGHGSDGTAIDTTFSSGVFTPIRVKSFILDAYYMLNGKKFSYAAAYDQSAYQLRSVGSLMVGAMYYYSHVRYDDPMDADMILMMDNIGRLRQWQVSLGAGYAYNFVPVRGLLISGMMMPMVTLYNRLKAYRYDSRMRQMAEDDETHDDGDMEELVWSTMLDPEAMQLRPDARNPEETHTSRVTLNFNARASLTYNLAGWAYINVYGQLYSFRFSQNQNHGSLKEWFVNASLGLRL